MGTGVWAVPSGKDKSRQKELTPADRKAHEHLPTIALPGSAVCYACSEHWKVACFSSFNQLQTILIRNAFCSSEMNLSPLEDASNHGFVRGGKAFTENDLDDVLGKVIVQTVPHMYFANTLLDDDAYFIFCLEGAGLMGENFQKFFASN